MTLKPYSIHRHFTQCSLCRDHVFNIPEDGWFSKNEEVFCVRTGKNKMFVFCEYCWVNRHEWIVRQILDHPLHQSVERTIREKMKKRFWELE